MPAIVKHESRDDKNRAHGNKSNKLGRNDTAVHIPLKGDDDKDDGGDEDEYEDDDYNESGHDEDNGGGEDDDDDHDHED